MLTKAPNSWLNIVDFHSVRVGRSTRRNASHHNHLLFAFAVCNKIAGVIRSVDRNGRPRAPKTFIELTVEGSLVKFDEFGSGFESDFGIFAKNSIADWVKFDEFQG